MSRIIIVPDIDNLIRRYIAGESEKQLALIVGISRGCFRNQLLKHGVKPRGRSESMSERMRQSTPEERQRISAAAHDAVRGRKRSIEDLHARALSRQRTLSQASDAEFELAGMLKVYGVNFIQQLAVGPYNIDIAINETPIAVEVMGHGNKRMTKSVRGIGHAERIEYLFNAGWNVVIVAIDSLKNRLTPRAADYIFAFMQELSINPTAPRQYRVIRGNGELKSRLSSEFQNGARIW